MITRLSIFLIVGGLYLVTALRKNKKEGDSVDYPSSVAH